MCDVDRTVIDHLLTEGVDLLSSDRGVDDRATRLTPTPHDAIAYSFQTPEKGKPNAAVILKVRILDKTRFIIVLETFAFFLEEKKKVTSVFTPLWYVCMCACVCVEDLTAAPVRGK